MATTTNYGWTTPDDTSLVKDGASAIRTLGSSVDTTVKNLNPETTLGDISYRSSTANTNTRLALGTAGQVLTVNSGATAPEWTTISSGGMTLLSTTTLSGASTVISSINQTYTNLYVIITGFTNLTASGEFRIAPNGATTSYFAAHVRLSNTTASTDSCTGTTITANANNLRTNNTGVLNLIIFDYASTTAQKNTHFVGSFLQPDSTSFVFNQAGVYRSNSAVSSLTITNSGGNFDAGTVRIYGVK